MDRTKRGRPPSVNTKSKTFVAGHASASVSPSAQSVASKQVKTPLSGLEKKNTVQKANLQTTEVTVNSPKVDTQTSVLKPSGEPNPVSTAPAKDSVARDKTMPVQVGKLDADVFKPFGACSRSSSDTGSETPYCKGGSGKQTCGDPVRDEDQGVGCDLCGLWFHAGCQSLPTDAYKALVTHKSLAWLCEDCKPALEDRKTQKQLHLSIMLEYKVGRLETALTDHLSRVEGTLKRQEELANKQTKLVDDVVKEVTRQESTYAGKVKGTCEEFFAKVSSKIDGIPQTPKTGAPSQVSELSGVLNDFMDKDRRKLNIVVHNLPESQPGNQAEDDATKVHNIIKEELKLIIKPTKAFRVGKRGDRPRLLIVTLENMEAKLEVLKLASQLRNSPTWSNIYLTKDMTWKEREELRKAKAELARRKENGEENLMIKGLKVVKREPRVQAQGDDTRSTATSAPRQPPSQGNSNQPVPREETQLQDGASAPPAGQASAGDDTDRPPSTSSAVPMQPTSQTVTHDEAQSQGGAGRASPRAGASGSDDGNTVHSAAQPSTLGNNGTTSGREGAGAPDGNTGNSTAADGNRGGRAAPNSN